VTAPIDQGRSHVKADEKGDDAADEDVAEQPFIRVFASHLND